MIICCRLEEKYRKLTQYKIREKAYGAIIIYGSCYGTAKIYAEALAERLKCEHYRTIK